MKWRFVCPASILIAILVSAVTVPAAGLSEETVDPVDRIRDGVRRGLQVVQKAARNYPENRSCFSCHHQTLPLLAMSVAREKGFPIDRQLLQDQADFTHKSFRRNRTELIEGKGVGGASMTVGYGLWALEIAKWPKDQTTSAMVKFLLKKQEKDGSWRRSTSRPPLEDSNFTCTILAVYYMQKFADEETRGPVEAAAARAKAWLLRAEPVSHEDRVSRLGALPLVQADPQRTSEARQEIFRTQRVDGGWGQLPDMQSDAYATGLALFTLQRIRVATSHPAYRRGVAFLLRTQCDDGSWFVKSRSKPIQRLFDNGDPHGKDQFISIAATSWATTALALALPDRRIREF